MPAEPPATLKWATEALPAIYTAGRFPLDNKAFAIRYRSATHAMHVHLYTGRMRLGEREIQLKHGDVTFSPAGVPSWYAIDAPGHHWCVHFAPARRKGTAFTLPIHAPLGAMAPLAGERVMTITRLIGSHDALGNAAAAAAMLELLIWLAMQTAPKPASLPPRSAQAAERVAAIVQERFAEPLYVPDLCDEVELSQNHLARAFGKLFGTTIQHYLLMRRIDVARYLLSSTSIPVHRVASRVGIDDPQYFNKQFRRVVGVSPLRFREQKLGAVVKNVSKLWR